MEFEMSAIFNRIIKEKRAISILREKIDPEPLMGFLVGYSKDFLQLNFISSEILLNGFSILRINDITNIDHSFRTREFVEKAIQLRKQRIEPNTKIELLNIKSILESINRQYPVITVHREMISQDTCSIGKITHFSDNEFNMDCLTPEAKWDGDYPSYQYKDVTKVDFGGLYEEALVLVAGNYPH